MTTKTKKRTNKRQKQVTLSEFKAWLEGVEELQPDGWAPNAEQWDLIRTKIHNIKQEKPPEPSQQQQMPSHIQHSSVNTPPPGIIHRDDVQVPPSQLPMDAEITPAARAALEGKTPFTPGPDGKIKTPDIDTSNGPYSTSFE